MTPLDSGFDSSLHKDKLRLSWDFFKSLILKNRFTGLPVKDLPQSFVMGEVMLQAFAEMNPAKSYLAEWRETRLIKRGYKPATETGRAIVTDYAGDKLLVQTRNTGTSQQTLGGVRLTPTVKPNQIGMIHTHPIDSLPTDTDLIHILAKKDIIHIIVTPRRVIVLIRTDETPHVSTDPNVTKGYLLEMARLRGVAIKGADEFTQEWFPNLASDINANIGWTLDYDALKELHIGAFEASRGQKTFRRKA